MSSILTHVVVGTNDPQQAVAFYDATFGALGIAGQRHDNGGFYGEPERGMFMVGRPRDGQPATRANGGTIGLSAKDQAAIDAWHAAGWPTAAATRARRDAATSESTRSTAPTCAIPTATSSAPLRRTSRTSERNGQLRGSMMERVSNSMCFGGSQGVYSHESASTGTPMAFQVYIPEHAAGARLPVLWWLSGLTCTHANAMEKCEYKRACAEHGIALIGPDTSPRGEDVPDDEAYDFGKGAGFYVDATQEPWAKHFKMRSYVEKELPALIAAEFPMLDMERQGISGHSMGGHGALTVSLRNPGRFRSTSAFAPIVSPVDCPWGQKALSGYIGNDRAKWREYDAVALIEDGARLPDLLVDQGRADQFLDEQLKTWLLDEACRAADMPATIRLHEGYDHSYFFVSTFIDDHIAWHSERLKA